MNHEQVHVLLYQALETELGGVHVYQTALQCTVNAELQHEWQEYLAQTETHVQILRELCATLKLNPDQETPGRQVVRHLGQELVTATEQVSMCMHYLLSAVPCRHEARYRMGANPTKEREGHDC